MKVLVTDDSLVMRKIITNVVESLGHQAIHAANGQDMLDVLAQRGSEIDLVLLDWNMPVLNGIDALRTMQENNAYRTIPVFMVSTESEDDKVAEAVKAGATGYLAKPFTAEDLSAKIRSALHKGSSS
jgi:two-component system, chemotaxis family, chemotaxis protein CheY